ncbi:sigma-70 family RNA polymerase sigma factor [Bacillus weihaiensis]|nr:sigma-70 family RNA polymerase sigma factor [Bacillus weihaiensis]
MDIDIVKRAINGENDAFLDIIHSYKVDLYKTAYAYLKNEDQALEAIQEVTFRAYQEIGKLREPAYVKTWIIRMMMNYCVDILKKNRRLVASDEFLDWQGELDDYSFLEIEEAMGRINENERQLLLLKYFHDLKIKDIALMLQVPEGTVKTRLYKSLKSLRSQIEVKGEWKSV